MTCRNSKESCGVTQTFLQYWFNQAWMHSHCAHCTVTSPQTHSCPRNESEECFWSDPAGFISSLPAGLSSLPAGLSSLPAGSSRFPAGPSSLPAGPSSLLAWWVSVAGLQRQGLSTMLIGFDSGCSSRNTGCRRPGSGAAISPPVELLAADVNREAIMSLMSLNIMALLADPSSSFNHFSGHLWCDLR